MSVGVWENGSMGERNTPILPRTTCAFRRTDSHTPIPCQRQATIPVKSDPPIESVSASAYTVPTEAPESDGTLAWDSTTMVLVEAEAGGETGLGYSYTHAAAARLIADTLAGVVEGRDALAVRGSWWAMQHAIRNLGRPGLVATAVAAVDTALWDLKARLLDLPLAAVLDAAHEKVPAYGSGGFTAYDLDRLREQLGGWVEDGLKLVKMKVGRDPDEDLDRAAAARDAIGDEAELMVDANGALSRKQALVFAHAFADYDVTWFEEPVSSDDLEGLRLLRDEGPPGMEITAGEYGYDRFYFRRMLDAEAVDVLQSDATRCLGITGFLTAGALCAARPIDLSAHTAPTLHTHALCAVGPARHVEYFYDHGRLEDMLFDGALHPDADGFLAPDRSRPGLGLAFRYADADEYQVFP